MPRYQYTAMDTSGKKVSGSIAAENPFAARKQLRLRSIHPVSVKEAVTVQQGRTNLLSVVKRNRRRQLIDFTKQLSTLLNSGIKLTEALSVLTMQTSDERFRNAISDIRDRVVTGEAFTDALSDYKDYFDVIYISMVRVGEVTGSLAGTLTTIANFMEKRQRVESKVVTAMVYPIVLVCFCMVAILILTTQVIPKIGRQIERTGQELPWVTQRLMDVGGLLTSWWKLPIVLLVLFIVFVGLRRFLKTPRGSYLRDKFLLSLPVIGPLIKQRVVARFASTLSTLLSSGLPMAQALKVVGEVTGNTLMKRAVGRARERILAGADIATPLRDSGVIDPTIAHMVSVGEKSGELETMLKNISENLESSTDIVIERLGAAVEPLIIIVMAAIIGIIGYATILPILQVSSVNF